MTQPMLLVVDDDREMCDELKSIFEDEGYKTDVAYNGSKGISKADKSPYKVVLLDLKMPDVDGYQVMAYLKNNHPQIKVIILSGKPMDAGKVEDALVKADAILQKPYNVENLIATVNKFAKN